MDALRSGAPRRVGDEAVERMITLTLEEQPAGATHWSTREMARRAGMSQTMVSRVWGISGLAGVQPAAAPERDLQLSRDPAFVDKVRDVAGLTPNPSDRALVLCVEPRGSPDVDEKPQVQAIEGTAPVLPMRPGQGRRTGSRQRAGQDPAEDIILKVAGAGCNLRAPLRSGRQQESAMKQPHTEETIEHTDDQQNTGNHKKPGMPDAGGADKFGGTRTGADNVEPAPDVTGDTPG